MINIWEINDDQEIAGYCQQHWQEECEHIIRIADEVSRGYFLFDLKWDMERTWEPVIFTGQIDWELIPKDDLEFVFQFNRHRFFICLGQAYLLTGQEKYAEKLVVLWSDWIKRVPKTSQSEKSTWRSLEAGIRGETWTKAFSYIKNSCFMTAELEQMIENSLIEQAEHIITVHSPYRYISNWGVIENHGLFEIGLAVSDQRLRERYLSTALKNLEIQAKMQIMRDGVHWEQSPMYHNEVFHCFEDVWILAQKHNVEIPEVIKETVLAMAYANLAWKKPDHHQFIMGDSDDTDIRDYLSIAAWLTNDPVLKFGGYQQLDFESIWEVGFAAVQQYQLLESRVPPFQSMALSDSGNYYLRSGWEESANLLHFHCGTLGAGHGHADQLHLDLVIHGEDVLMDAGRYTYVDGPERREFKDPCNHNTITVDHQWFTICQDAWACSKLSQPVKQGFLALPEYEFVQGGHLGYMDRGIFMNRKLIHIKPDIYLVVDECYASDQHTYQHYFHFNNNGEVNVSEQQNRVRYQGKNCTATVQFLGNEIRIKQIVSRISRHYNQAKKRCAVVVHKQAAGFSSLLTVIQAEQNGLETELKVEKIPVYSALKKTVYPEAMAEAVKVTTKDGIYVVIICHQEVNSPTDMVVADGCMGFGNVIVFDVKKSKLIGTVLNF